MKLYEKTASIGLIAILLLAGALCQPVAAQDPIVTPIVVSAAAPIVVKALTPKPSKWVKFQGTVMSANTAQITARDKNNELSIQTFALSQPVSAKMQQIIDKGGYQYGDKVTIFYDPATRQVMNLKGKPSKPI